MKRIVLYKIFNLEQRSYRWSVEADGDYEAYEVEIPDDFSIRECKSCEKIFFQDGDPNGYELVSEGKNKSCRPVLVGGRKSSIVNLKVIKPE